MDQHREYRTELPGDAGAPGTARALVRSALHEAGLDAVADDAVLLTSELCENSVLHAGTGFELAITVAGAEVTVAVTDQGATAMELRRAAPSDRRDTHNRGLVLVDALASAWGSRHDGSGHQVWFTLGAGNPVGPPPSTVDLPDWPDMPTARWLLHIPARVVAVSSPPVLITELIRRLCDVLRVGGAAVRVDSGDGERTLAAYGKQKVSFTVALPLDAPLRGRLLVGVEQPTPAMIEIAELTAQRVALVVESDHARRAGRDRLAWMTYLTEASELLGNSLDVTHTASMVPQILVPRLGNWCAVHLLDARGWLRLAARSHADEAELARLSVDLPAAHDVLNRLVAGGPDVVGLPAPIEGVAVPLRVGHTVFGTLSVGRRAERAHGPEEIMMITELARRAAQALDNAQRNTTLAATAQALQQALLPRALPTAGGVRFAAAYLPVSAGADVGGDFYDVVPIDDDRWLVAVGDVCGNGPRAAARTSLVRDVLRVLVRDGQPLSRAVELLNEMMLEAAAPEQFATVALALVSRQQGTLAVELVLAGHEQPVLARANGTVGPVGRHGSAVGLFDSFAVTPTRHVLGPGDTLVFYTDGIIERRRGVEQFGHDRLVRAVATMAGAVADKVVTALMRTVHEFSPEPHRDDIVIMVVQAPAAP